jgi:hypothetical protein
MSLNGKILYCAFCKLITKRLIFPGGSDSKTKVKENVKGKNCVVLSAVYTVLDYYST